MSREGGGSTLDSVSGDSSDHIVRAIALGIYVVLDNGQPTLHWKEEGEGKGLGVKGGDYGEGGVRRKGGREGELERGISAGKEQNGSVMRICVILRWHVLPLKE